jgi:hypothetical protein
VEPASGRLARFGCRLLGVLRAGEALQHILVEATRLDFVVSLLSQVAEVPPTRDRLRKELDLEFHPASADEDRSSSSNAGLQATGCEHDHSETGD